MKIQKQILQTLQQNDTSVEKFGSTLKELVHKERGEFRNILIIGPASCGKTFLLKPVSLVYRSFGNPATSTFVWVGEEQDILLTSDTPIFAKSSSELEFTKHAVICDIETDKMKVQ